MQEVTPMEKIKAYHNIKGFLTKEQKKLVEDMLDLKPIDIEKRIWGKENEVELVLMIYLLGFCKGIVGFEEGVANLTNTVASDLYIELNSGEKIIVEIKSTEDKSLKITKGLFKKKLDFANSLNSKLYFATKISGHWALYNSDYFQENNYRIKVDKDFLNSDFNSVFGERTFAFPKGLKISSTYSKTAKDNMKIQNNGYGYLIKYKVQYLGKTIITINSSKNENFFLIFVYENLQDIMSNDTQKTIEKGSDITVIEEELNQDMIIANLSTFILAPIKHMMSELGHLYDFNQYLTNLIDEKENFIRREHVLYGLQFLVRKGYPILEKIEDKFYYLKDRR